MSDGLSESLFLSLKVALVGASLALPVAIAAAYLLARGRFPGRVLFDGLVNLPLVLPPVVIGYLLLVLFGIHGPLGAPLARWTGLVFAFHWSGAALAAGVMALPLMVRPVRLGFEAIDPGLEQAAATLGAGAGAIFRGVTLPLAAPSILAGWVIGLARSLGEFGATITFVSNIPGETRTLPLALYTATQVPGGEAMAGRLILVSLLLAFALLLVADRLGRRLAARLGPAVRSQR